LRNSAAHRERGFELTAREYLLAEQEAEQRGLRLLGFFHSHVDVPAVPSALDRRQAAHFLGGVIVPVEHGVAGRPVVFHSRG
jgi:proteasome lid subunit RPN8/RPN11